MKHSCFLRIWVSIDKDAQYIDYFDQTIEEYIAFLSMEKWHITAIYFQY